MESQISHRNDQYTLIATASGLSLVPKEKHKVGYELEVNLPAERGINYRLTRSDLSDVSGHSHLRVYRTPMCIHIDTPSGRRLLDCPRKERSVRVYGSRGADPRHHFSWNGRDFMLSGHFRIGGKHRVCQDVASGQKVVAFKHSLLTWKGEGTIVIDSEIPRLDADVILAAFMGFYMFDERRDSKVSYCT